MATEEQIQLEIEARRRKVAALYLAHLTQEQIAREVGVSQATISGDIAAIKQQYRAERTEIIEREAAELDAMERDCAVLFNTSKDPEWIRIRTKLKERRAKMLGLDAPTKNVHSGPDGKPIEQRITATVEDAGTFDRKVFEFAARAGAALPAGEPDAGRESSEAL